ncbi:MULTISPECIES: metal ABC transporter permease [Romboutsia]|nr:MULTISPECIES: metal ABC transporter permease [Romboutsia]MCH1960580.1 metal ABC transporter permease [Romboutsia hominis]MCH1968988.1 metal ABC transporter permease [Romboutsia hominis]MDB8790273.1 metal ABC transporter permease [Romboutsia sp. 1001216sp1]MDB8793520.1 metal ABC transporter permease [Romboutsia sp. 1001216sp1]MDB8797062.1 metal ABC transporter permease [Romboutsia sp. 1001216sp1]
MEIFQYDFMVRALTASLIVGLICPLMGMFIVFKKLSLIGDSLSHIALSGIASATIVGVNPLIGSLVASSIAAIIIDRLRTYLKEYADLSIAIIMALGVGISGILISISNTNFDLFSFMYGSIATVSSEDIKIIIMVAIIIILFVSLLFKELLYITFDEENAKFSKIPVKLINTIFMILVAASITITLRIVGVLLVSSLISIPVATSLKVAKSFKQSIFYSVLFGEIAIISGVLISFYLDIAPGGTIVIISVLELLGVTVFSKLINSKHKKIVLNK